MWKYRAPGWDHRRERRPQASRQVRQIDAEIGVVVMRPLEVVGNLSWTVRAGLGLQLDDPAAIVDKHRVVRRATLLLRMPCRKVDRVDEDDVAAADAIATEAHRVELGEEPLA
jgi:hypothetical protein